MSYDCAQLQYTTQHRTSFLILPPDKTTIIAQMLSIGGEGKRCERIVFVKSRCHRSAVSVPFVTVSKYRH